MLPKMKYQLKQWDHNRQIERWGKKNCNKMVKYRSINIDIIG